MGTFSNTACVLAVGGVLYFAANQPPARHGPESPLPVPVPASRIVKGGTMTVAADGDGQFWIDGTAEGSPLRFLVDTGAASVALSKTDAGRIGLDVAHLTFDSGVMTANGFAPAATTWLSRLTFGPFIVTGVQVTVIDADLRQPLLGMWLLRRMTFSVRNGTLHLSGKAALAARNG